MRWPVLVLVLVALLAGPMPVRADGAGAGAPLRIVQAAVFDSDDETPPPESAAWRNVRLDAANPPATPRAARYTWLRIEVPLAGPPPTDRPLAVFAARLQREVAIFVNGRQALTVHSTGFDRRVVCCALFAELPADAGLLPGTNRLVLRLGTGPAGSRVLTPLHVGDAAVLWKRYEWRVLARGAGQVAALLLAVAVGAACLGLWWRRREERGPLLFGLSTSLYAVASAMDLGLANTSWAAPANMVYAFADYGSAVLMLNFLLHHAGWRWPRVEAGLWAWVAASVVLELFTDYYDPGSAWSPWWYTGIAAYLATLPLAAAIAWQRRDLLSALLALGAAVSAGLIGWQVVARFVDSELLYLWPYHPLALFVVIAAMLIDRLVRALGESESLNAELERRVEAKRRELEANHARLRVLESERAVVAERQRIMTDMHDGIGGALISTLAWVEHGGPSKEQVAAALRECIDDLRLTIDSLEPAEGELAPVLGGLRYRIEGRLRQQGIALDWKVGDLPPIASLTPANVLHILRILQEAFTNVLKHAGADRIEVETGLQPGPGRLFIRVRDNGRGFAAGASPGHGLANMRRRAQAVGGELRVQPAPGGTTLELLLPAA